MSETLRHYELMLILAPDKSANERDKIITGVQTDLTKKDAEITHLDAWPLRQFTFSIKKYDEGYYYIMNFKIEAKHINALDKLFRLNTDIVRHLMVKVPEEGYHYFVYENDKEFYLGEGVVEHQSKDRDVIDEVEEEVTPKPAKKTAPVKAIEEKPVEAEEVKEEPKETSEPEKVEEKPVEKAAPQVEEKKEVKAPEKKEEKPVEEEQTDEDRLRELDKKLDQLLLDD
jgi:small subunit ribosomal protein S6